jgi:FKBP-type peptidyl-prolyl cis-trans isomerase 2
LRSFGEYWKRLVQRPGRSATPQADAPQGAHVDAAQEDRGPGDQVAGVLHELGRDRARYEGQLAELGDRLAELEATRETATRQSEALRLSLAETVSRLEAGERLQKGMETKLEDERTNHLNAVQELGRDRARHEGQLAELGDRVAGLEATRETATRQAEALRLSLTETVSRLEAAERLQKGLETKFENERKNHLNAMQEARVRERRQERRFNLMMATAVLALLFGVLVGVKSIRDDHENIRMLSAVRKDIEQMRLSMVFHLEDQHDRLQNRLASLSDAIERMEAAYPGAAPYGARVGDAQDHAPSGAAAERKGQPETIGSEVPGPGNDAGDAGSAGARRQSRAEMQAFFRENAMKEGVISLPSGLQYKVLRRGSGRTPQATDTVVLEYRIYTANGDEIADTTGDPGPTTLAVNAAIPGLREALLRMEEGARWELYVPPALSGIAGTRKRGLLGFVPRIYVVDLLSVIEWGSGDERDEGQVP